MGLGACPETLDALAPRFIAALPPDVVGGQSLKYRRTDDGRFVLYSVGRNGTDDGGKVVLKEKSKSYLDLDQGDWVWLARSWAASNCRSSAANLRLRLSRCRFSSG